MAANKETKLSKLQRWILIEALKGITEHRDPPLNTFRILTGYFKLPAVNHYRVDGKASGYNSASAAMYRAQRRLRARGLLTEEWGNYLTVDGARVAEELKRLG